MGLSDIADKGQIIIKKHLNRYIIEFSDYSDYGTATTRSFESRSLKLAYLMLEEYLKFGAS